jgi:hypothetical protein
MCLLLLSWLWACSRLYFTSLTRTFLFLLLPFLLPLYTTSPILTLDPPAPTLNHQDQDSSATTNNSNNNNQKGTLCASNGKRHHKKLRRSAHHLTPGTIQPRIITQPFRNTTHIVPLVHYLSSFLLVGGQIASAGLWKIHRGTKRTTGQEVAVFVSLSCRLLCCLLC